MGCQRPFVEFPKVRNCLRKSKRDYGFPRPPKGLAPRVGWGTMNTLAIGSKYWPCSIDSYFFCAVFGKAVRLRALFRSYPDAETLWTVAFC